MTNSVLATKTLKNQEKNKAKSFDFLPTSTTNQIVKHEYYSLSYNEKYEQAEWLAYELKKSYVRCSNFDRPYFIEDTKVKTGLADWRNYKKSGYDKEHLCQLVIWNLKSMLIMRLFLLQIFRPKNTIFMGEFGID